LVGVVYLLITFRLPVSVAKVSRCKQTGALNQCRLETGVEGLTLDFASADC